MVKRPSRGLEGADVLRKRQKVVHEAPTFEEVNHSRHLQQLLTFDQDQKRARHGIQSLKVFLDGFSSGNGDNKDRFTTLREYLDAARPRDTSDNAVHLGDIMETWSYAAQVNNEAMMSAVPAVLALLLQVASQTLELLPHALDIARTLLQERQLKLIARCLSAPKGSGYVISPTLRLVRELVMLDGGTLARRVFRARDHTFASFARNLEIRHLGGAADGEKNSSVEDPSRPSVRTNAIKLFLSCLKFLPAEAKKEMLMLKEVFSHLTFLLKDDPPYLILEMLAALKKHVLLDDKLPREVKFRTFNTKTLDRLAGLYAYRHDVEGDGKPSVRGSVHEFLLYTCTTPGAGVLYSGTGIYPKELEDEAAQDVKSLDDYGLERIAWMDKYKDDIAVANFVLSEFIQKLRPWSSLKHSELIVAIFQAAPELVASYFLNNKSFTFEPKLSMTWIGYAAFLFNTVNLPLPPHYGPTTGYRRVPPPTSILLDNILPLPLKQRDLVRCLSNKSTLISFFAIRILVLALQKLEVALKMHREAAESSKSTWEMAARKLIDEFYQKIPDMKEVTKCYKAMAEENVLQREAASRLLLLYYEVIPQVALRANFDVSPFLVKSLTRLDSRAEEPQNQALALMELENLIAIAGYSPGMRWFAKTEGLAASPFVALLKFYVENAQGRSKLKEVLESVAVQHQLVLQQVGLTPLLRAARELKKGGKPRNLDLIWEYLDNCAGRCAASPLKYVELMQESVTEGQVGNSTSLILATVVEQLPFVADKATDKKDLEHLSEFLTVLLSCAQTNGEAPAVIGVFAKKMTEILVGRAPAVVPKADVALLGGEAGEGAASEVNGAGPQRQKPVIVNGELDDSSLEAILDVPFGPDEDNSALLKWNFKSVEDLVDEGYAAALIRLLWSEHASIRQEALTNILKMAAKFKESTYEEKDQIWLLLSELAESSRVLVARGPVPSPLVSFAISALEVLKNPLHCLYAKVNSFLTRGPVWQHDKVPLAHDILHGAPSDDDKYYTEVSWLLAYLLDGLRTPADLAVYHQKKWFEKVFALAGNPYMRANLRTRILRVLWRATCIEGGSTTLATRFGIVSWLEAQEARCGGGGEPSAEDKVERIDADSRETRRLYRALRRRVWETCDQERVGEWSRKGIPSALGA
ncbi:ribosome biogenesis protein Urb1 [Colletotrichum graminicola]|uniref:Ribosome biogenesis protein Urb1 n=1 Tax=Colletotrichum graminicola (strain M1.001 / M2 / FGSC 10212) TaxID=645133 RepID=E3QII3_COLGM|nr:ribosome biogenesis protein Urb1 [Colletotrichum graminicola M1.001]EFQ30593.1 ribosome biogenesis protein Urb1 [Colletotrichum graminicola M1.001]WDK21318.1 ribosome biogenesis protein Urb1 [Colletotrichum graminicola]